MYAQVINDFISDFWLFGDSLSVVVITVINCVQK